MLSRSSANANVSTLKKDFEIPLYNSLPSNSVALLEELESLLSIRYRMLHTIEMKMIKSDGGSYAAIAPLIQHYEKDIGWNKALDSDINSHFILSVAFCKYDQDRIWFAVQEAKLFMARLVYYGIDQEETLKKFNIPLERQDNVSDAMLEKIKFRERTASASTVISTTIYRIPFEFALNLIPTMQYYLNKGYVYISKAEITHLIETVLKENIVKKLNVINRNLDRILSDSRVNHLINNFQSQREIESLAKTSGNSMKIDILSQKDVDSNAERTFPLCMQLIHRHLTEDSHLMHNGRLQYGLFLKGTGLSLEESLNFWKNKFSKKTPEDKFEKQYAYNIRHNYGQEGKRNDYPPYSCVKIQNLPPPSSNESHGCPFKTYSEDVLRNLLFSVGLKELDVLKVLEKKKNNEYSVACVKYFEAKYPGATYEKVGIHPNHYYNSAAKLFVTKPKESESNKKTIAYENTK